MLSRIYDFIPIHMFTCTVNYGFHVICDTADSRCFPNYYKYRTIVMGQWHLYDMLILFQILKTPSMVYNVWFLPPPLSCLGILLVFTFVWLFDTRMAVWHWLLQLLLNSIFLIWMFIIICIRNVTIQMFEFHLFKCKFYLRRIT